MKKSDRMKWLMEKLKNFSIPIRKDRKKDLKNRQVVEKTKIIRKKIFLKKK